MVGSGMKTRAIKFLNTKRNLNFLNTEVIKDKKRNTFPAMIEDNITGQKGHLSSFTAIYGYNS